MSELPSVTSFTSSLRYLGLSGVELAKQLRPLYSALKTQLTDPSPIVVVAACETIESFARRLGAEFEPAHRCIVPQLLDLSSLHRTLSTPADACIQVSKTTSKESITLTTQQP